MKDNRTEFHGNGKKRKILKTMWMHNVRSTGNWNLILQVLTVWKK